MILSTEAFARARRFVETKARPLEVARMRFHFDSAPADAVLAELEKFRNRDGGFGNALEPDLRALESSALATSIAFQYIRETGQPPFGSTGSRAVDYLRNTFNKAKGMWRIIPQSAENSPHAPWWNQSAREDTFESCSLNPTAELLGYLCDYRDTSSEPLIAMLSSKILDHISRLETIEMHEFLCCKRLAETEGLDTAFREQLLGCLHKLLNATVSTDSSQWAGYGLRPLQVADRPDSPFYGALIEAVNHNLDYEISTQQEDGTWAPTFSWGDKFPDEWETAKLEWAGVVTVDKLITLQRYGRIDGSA